MTFARPRSLVLPVLGAVLLVAVLATVALGPVPWVVALAGGGVGMVTAAWAAMRLRSERLAHARDLARWSAAEAVLGERIAIARDLHDLVSHGLGLITVRAAAVRHTAAVAELAGPAGTSTTGSPTTVTAPTVTELRAALEDVEQISRDATLELRRMLRALRGADDPAPLRPSESLAAVPEIVEATRRAGLTVDLQADPLPDVSPGVQLAVCAVVREGLANAARHAGATHAQVRLATDSDGAVRVEVTDAGPAPHWVPAPGAGHGVTGLRERVLTLGGTLEAGPQGSGYRLTAWLPDRER
ncbi:sensor histidine kinase [Cellulomonas phragmiteti]|uniref:sensor histidine kinase n=1 Tax=Cellulomonas phragmiteti TaxID=478780 RepID=UPI0019430100|nr:ATP-binding protein [Cellulomonas phragmiteti]